MMGERQSGQDSLFYGFSLEAHVPDDHMLRAIDKFADCPSSYNLSQISARAKRDFAHRVV